MKIQNFEWLVALLGISKLAIADTVFNCNGTPITADHIKTAYENSRSSSIEGYPTVMRIQYYNDANDYNAYPILLNGETSLPNPHGHYFLIWTDDFSKWNVIIKYSPETKFCEMKNRYWGNDFGSILYL
ncbi:CSEP0448 putative effector protein [Blumeria hordei DH14]|uniref:CSEP0448 putative effector protein n=1 Tax=Blumeria graminis f. sp. hordei (strain DH14) TaxID=546991 RepID=N1JJ19_BLUG1|nr:CSEP0448 putative effector protein [Blumeria hordei DH14]